MTEGGLPDRVDGHDVRAFNTIPALRIHRYSRQTRYLTICRMISLQLASMCWATSMFSSKLFTPCSFGSHELYSYNVASDV